MPAPEPNATRAAGGEDNIELVWGALLSAARLARREQAPNDGSTYGVDSSGALHPVPAADRFALMVWQQPIGWTRATNASRPISRRLRPAARSRFSTTVCVAIPA